MKERKGGARRLAEVLATRGAQAMLAASYFDGLVAATHTPLKAATTPCLGDSIPSLNPSSHGSELQNLTLSFTF